MFVKKVEKHDAAEAYCKRNSGQLIEWRNPKEAKVIATYYRKKSSKGYTIWIGLRQETFGGYAWKWGSGKRVTYQPWISAKAMSKSYPYECAHVIMGGKRAVISTVGKWGGSSCGSKLYTVCMKKCKSKLFFNS